MCPGTISIDYTLILISGELLASTGEKTAKTDGKHLLMGPYENSGTQWHHSTQHKKTGKVGLSFFDLKSAEH